MYGNTKGDPVCNLYFILTDTGIHRHSPLEEVDVGIVSLCLLLLSRSLCENILQGETFSFTLVQTEVNEGFLKFSFKDRCLLTNFLFATQMFFLPEFSAWSAKL